MSVKQIGAVALLLLSVAGCTDRAKPVSAAQTGCGSPVVTEALPTWARTGFSDDGSGTPHVVGRSGDILGVLFGNPLSAPPAPGRGNKILWVSHFPPTTGDTLHISATRAGTSEKVERQVDGGPGPSIVDLPAPGCWHLSLRWSGHLDTMDLTYS
jgi:hypothetical protein